MGFGDYPAEYNPKVHGPYYPWRYYGKPDTPFGEVKLGELGSWLSRRNKSPRAMVQACSRAFFRWQHKYVLPKHNSAAHLLQLSMVAMIYFYIINYKRLSEHRHQKYHW